ncbi:hypothetical protein I3842_11G086800 [Carya illinoinensis]|uniref:Uncharacterized protein n=1 Tax=Carya illinoinensis TaxID=32201 RepID=A0A922DNX9_CARIL|nr:hypothetical protein I3842_11G086800 [Carya illinoinensis]
MQGGGEALNFLAVLTVIRAFAHVYSVIDVLTETLYEILDFCVVVVVLMMLLAVLVWLQRDTFLELSREMSRKIVAQYQKSSNIFIPFTKIVLQGDCLYVLVFWKIKKVLCVDTK